MVSPERLRRYPIFSTLTDGQIKAISMIAENKEAEKGKVILEECGTADYLYLLEEGGLELFFTVRDEYRPELNKEYFVGEIGPGEIFGVSALIEPFVYSSSVRASANCKYIEIDGQSLRALFTQDTNLAYKMMHQVAKAVIERLAATRVQLAAAWAQ